MRDDVVKDPSIKENNINTVFIKHCLILLIWTATLYKTIIQYVHIIMIQHVKVAAAGKILVGSKQLPKTVQNLTNSFVIVLD